MMYFLSPDWSRILSHLSRIGVAFPVALPVACDREKGARSACLRTFTLVAVAASGYILISRAVLGGEPGAQARTVRGLITGTGFIGGGAILKDGASVRGTATAASIWNTGAIRASVAYDRFEIAIVLSLINFFTLRWLTPLKQSVNHSHDRHTPS
ncbi:MAG TPA: MgtC/SapB family protein [Blastocatellia bacterium]|nr:MgtC/SapB family protein [Blastocatellia bacterium]